MATSNQLRFSLLAIGLPALVAFACGGRTGEEIPSEFAPSSGGSGNAAASGAAAASTGARSALGTTGGGAAPGATGSGSVGRGPTTGPGVGAGGVVIGRPPVGTGGFIVTMPPPPPPIGAGGVVGVGGAFPFGGTGGIYTGPTQCASPRNMSIEFCPAPVTPVDTCCTADYHCGIQIASDPTPANIPFRGGCQPLNQVGRTDPGCPSFIQLVNAPSGIDIPGCCRLDGTCGVDLGLLGAGCVQSLKGGATIPCGAVDAGVFDASPPAVDSGRD